MTHAPNDFALVIGIDHYPGLPVGKSLRGAAADATKFAEWLRSRGGLSPENVHLLCSREKPLAPLQDAIDAELGAIRDCRSSSLIVSPGVSISTSATTAMCVSARTTTHPALLAALLGQ
jgi:hypothetical protein